MSSDSLLQKPENARLTFHQPSLVRITGSSALLVSLGVSQVCMVSTIVQVSTVGRTLERTTWIITIEICQRMSATPC